MFYVVDNPLQIQPSDAPVASKLSLENYGYSKCCEDCGTVLMPSQWLPPYQVTIHPSIYTDFLFGYLPQLLISEKVKSLYQAYDLQGFWGFHDVELWADHAPSQAKYYYADPVLSNVRVDLEKTHTVFYGDQECSTCQIGERILLKLYSLHFENPESIPFDVFHIRMLRNAIVSQRFKDMVDAHELTNIVLTPCEDFLTRYVRD